jgi:Zn finger protein HypA/HybF involved in hydrogenase expression
MTAPSAHTCARCEVDYRPALTDGACPVCRTPAVGYTQTADARRLDLRVLVVGVSAVDVLLLGLGAWWVFG